MIVHFGSANDANMCQKMSKTDPKVIQNLTFCPHGEPHSDMAFTNREPYWPVQGSFRKPSKKQALRKISTYDEILKNDPKSNDFGSTGFDQNDAKIQPNPPQCPSGSPVVPKWHQRVPNCCKIDPNWSKRVQKWCPNATQLLSNWLSKWSLCSNSLRNLIQNQSINGAPNRYKHSTNKSKQNLKPANCMQKAKNCIIAPQS